MLDLISLFSNAVPIQYLLIPLFWTWYFLMACIKSELIENFFIDDDKDSVQIFPVTTNNMVLTVSQFRPGIEKTIIELPGGGLEKGEDPKEAASRELKEETGYTGTLVFLGKLNYSPYSSGYKYLFAAKDCKKISGLELDENEFLSVVKWPMNKFRKTISGGKIRGTDCIYMGLDALDLL